MQKYLCGRNTKQSFFNAVKKKYVFKYLMNNAQHLSEHRGVPIAVFANDAIGARIFTNGIYENENIEDLFSILSNLDMDYQKLSVLDIGANIGNHALQLSQKFKTIAAFEPNPRTYELLCSNTKRIGNISCHNIGLGTKSDKMQLFEDPQNFGGASTVYKHQTGATFDIKIKALDELAEQFQPIGLIKIDVEGMEYDVLKGASQTLDANKPIICFEQHRNEFSEDATETKSIDYLRQKGYQIFHLDPTSKSNLFARFFKKISSPFLGIRKRRNIICSKMVMEANYGMLFAIHESALIKKTP